MRWLANHEQVSYRTINRFRSQETTAHLLAEAFVLFRRQLITNQVIDNEALFIDGTKIEADYLPRNQKYEIYNRLFQERKVFLKQI